MRYIDSVTINSYRRYFTSDLTVNPQKYKIELIDNIIKNENRDFFQPFMEKKFKGNPKQREKIFVDNYLELEKLFLKEKKPLNHIHLYLKQTLEKKHALV